MENQSKNSQGFAIASLIIGILAFLLCFIPCINISAFIFGPAAIIFGVVAISKTNTPSSPKSMGIAGICLGGVAIFMAILMYSLIATNSDKIKDKVENYFDWAKEYDDDFQEEFNDAESLDNLEKALDDLEGVADEVNKDINDAVKDVHSDVKEALDDAKKDIKKAKEKKDENIE
ncbi:MAG: DUF4190 domain-containing protein [Salinivirgaceae bacterium]|nr:DUF4190 domain-containing protein [Salinivirgaceae bacterium]